MEKSKKWSVRDLCFIGVFVAIIAVLAQVSIPMPGGIPMTLQTFAVPLAAIVLGWKKGMIAAVVYILLGAAGAPVFTQFSGGLARVIGPTGGFIFSFPIMAFIVGFGAERCREFKGIKPLWLATALALGSIVNLSMGMIHLSILNQITLAAAFSAAVAPFILLEVIKMALAFVVGPQLWRLLQKIM